ncbi:MAG: CDP-diacylglycerol--glycerol-3-phosphate 3-phosphatidyltransferase [Actinomycetales bacterium]|nr:CDP-diacylglycerol--glycerol-3-phosphate 3-phosphatidyltransferase [Actinomycetales bacterium]
MSPAPPERPGPWPASAVLNLPNALTGFRLACVPMLVALLAMPVSATGLSRDAAAAVFVVASITDILDGAIARRRGLVTTFGTIADPIADKALTGTALVGLSVLGELPWWVSIVILAREIGVTLLRLWVLRAGVIPASRGGKLKTVVQTIAITMYLVVLPAGLEGLDPWWQGARALVMAVAVVLTVATGADYVRRALRLRADARDLHER